MSIDLGTVIDHHGLSEVESLKKQLAAEQARAERAEAALVETLRKAALGFGCQEPSENREKWYAWASKKADEYAALALRPSGDGVG